MGTEVVALAPRMQVAGLQGGAEPLVEGQRRDQGTGRARLCSRLISRAVVDHKHVCCGHVLAHVGDHGGDGALLVPGWDEDQCPHSPRFSHAARSAPGGVCVSNCS